MGKAFRKLSGREGQVGPVEGEKSESKASCPRPNVSSDRGFACCQDLLADLLGEALLHVVFGSQM